MHRELKTDSLREIDSVSSFIESVKQLKEKQEGSSSELYFRGQETEFWNIEPSIFRNDMLSIEHKLMQIPLQKAPVEFREFHSMFDIMTKYQHYGMCTRLLDLTTNPLVALYFACKIHGEEEYDSGEFKEPYGVIYYTDKYYPSQASDEAVQIISALAKYDLSKENTLDEVLTNLNYEHIKGFDKDTYLQHDNYKKFIKIIQQNYMVTPMYTNERLKKQSGVFLLASLFSFNQSENIKESVISKTKCALNDDFNKDYFFVRGENKESILKELDLYNINEATLFPELEHQLNYIRSSNSYRVQPVSDFTKYIEDENNKSATVYINSNKLDKYILDNLKIILGSIVAEEDLHDISSILKSNITVDWYKRDPVISKIRFAITGFYSTKGMNKNDAKAKATQILDEIIKAVGEFGSVNLESDK